jgi:exodeoxyribonuclease VII small subunit
MAGQAKYKDYESAMERLGTITEQLEAGEPTLEEAIKLYTEGLEIAKFCNDKLNVADEKIKIISQKNGLFEEEEFDEGDA